MKVSIIIPFYNCPYIDQAIQSALNQTYKNIEVIVVNDGSTKYIEKIKPFLKQIKYLEKVNGGTASALNMGIQNATGEYFAWLSSDDIYHPQKTQNQLYFLQSNNFSASYTNYYLINEKGSVISPPQGINITTKLQFLKIMKRKCIINGCTVMLKMNIFNEFGLFDETLKYTQDYDFWLRILKKYDISNYNEPLVNYRIHSNMGTKKYKAAIRLETLETINRHKGKINELIQTCK
ncbi:glycosyltransferase [Fictibacillus barbaricus]|uniref:Glycosyltransferase involved in cell wall biosynthesis n=1 Tax=Fictibacillus barbaricus TaxID=182136 RepID=A0ABU1TXV5_9BACL|nr:glycosyltransferase [Fictibacillus barbaricus]MDR7072045.1 glycosyltransferase involved in cell wall biosynthesis [Fictibacillus barbaricus]